MRKSKIMKALLVFGMSVVTATSMVGLVACNNNSGESGNGGGNGGNGGNGGGNGCNHEYTGTYKGYWADANEHWKECDVCAEETGRGPHVDANNDNACDDCGWEIAHKFATEWTSDATGHYKAATCTHTTLKDQEGAHVDEDETPNKCDVCGYEGATSTGYKSYKENKIEGTAKMIDETFFVSKNLPLFDKWGTVGLYASHNDSTNKVDVSGGKANLITPAKEPATCLYVDWGNVTASVVKGYFKISDVKGTNGYTAIQFTTSVDGKDSELFGVRTNKGGVYKYRLNGGGDQSGNSACTAAWANGGEFYYEYDANANKITMTIDGQPFVTDLELNGTTLKGIKFSSGSGNADTFSIDDIAVYKTVVSVDDYKAAIGEQAATLKGKIKDGITVDVADIDLTNAADNAACDTALANYTTALVSAYNTAVKAKIEATYPAADYDADNNWDKPAYTEAATAFNTAMESANTMDKINAAYDAANNALSGLKNDDDEYWTKTDAVITVGTKTLTVKEGDTVTKDQLDALVVIPNGKTVSGYTAGGEAITLPYTVTASVELTAVLEDLALTDFSFLCKEAEGTWTENKVLAEGVTILADATNTVVVDGSAKNVGSLGKSTTRIKLGGTGTKDYRSVMLDLKAGATIKIYALSSSSSADRNVALYDKDFTKLQSKTCGGSGDVKELVYTVSGAGIYYIGSEASGLNIYGIVIEYTK